MPPMVGHRLASWTLIHELDTTGMSRVYLARNEAGRLAALKVPLREDHYERFANEVRLSRRIRSAFVAQVVDARPDPPEPYVAFEYIQGPTLSDQVRLAGPKPDLRLLAIGLAEGLRQIHHAGIVHRDLKPGNVIVTAERPIIIDFGIARDPDDDRLTQAGMVVGTRAWLSPEQERGEPVGPSSDIYNWARLIEWSADRGVADASAVSADGMSVDLCAVVADALVDDPAARPTAEQIVTRLTGHDGATLADDFAHNWVMAPVSVPAMEDRSSPEPQNTSGPVVVGASSPPSGPSASDIATPRSDVGDVAKPSPLRRRGPARPLALGMLASVLAAVAVGVFLIAPWITSDRASSREAAGDSSGAELGLGGDTDADTDQAATPIPSVDDPEHPTSTSNADSDSGETPVREAVPGTEADVDSPDGAEPQLPRYTPSPQPIVAAHVRLSDSGHGCEGGLCGCPASGSYSRIDIEHGAAHPYASDLVTVSMTWSGNAPIEGQLVTFRPDYARGYHWTRIGYRQEAFLDVERQYWVSADGSIEENLRYVTDRVHLDGRSYYGWKKDNSDGWEGKKRPRGQSHATSHVLCYRQPATSEWKTTIPITVVEPEQCRYSTHGQVYENCYEDTFEWRSGRAIVSDVDWYEWFSACRFRCTRE